MRLLILELADILKDYRSNENLNPTILNIEKWIHQFTVVNQKVILEEMIHIFKCRYLTELEVEDFLTKLVTNDKLVTPNYWNEVSLLKVQTDGNSQNIMVDKFKNILNNEIQINVSINDNTKNKFIYLDDFLFTGGRLRNDLTEWFKNAPRNARLDITIALVL